MTPSIKDIFATLESQWESVCTEIICAKTAEHADDSFYGAGFWSFYADYTVFGTPCFAMNTEAHLAADPYSDSNRWIPPNWRFDCITEATDAMDSLYEQLSNALDGKTEEDWEEAIEEHKQTIASVCHKVTAAANSGASPLAAIAFSSPFVVGIFEEQDGEYEYDRLAKLSVDSALIQKVGIPIG